MSSNYKLVFGVVLGAALGAAAVQGLHAQAKPKAYSVTETELLDATAQAAYSPQVQAAQKAAGGRSFRTAGGRVVALEGAAAPKPLPSGIASSRQRHFTSRQPGRTLPRSVTRRSRPYGGTRSKP